MRRWVSPLMRPTGISSSPVGPSRSRLLLGTGGIPSLDVLDAVLEASATALATVAVRRVDPAGRGGILDVLRARERRRAAQHRRLLHRRRSRSDRQAGPRGVSRPTGSSSRSSATRTRCCPTPWSCSTPPSNCATTASSSCPTPTTTPSLARRLEQVGCAAVMPLGAPIGSGLGIRNPHNIALIAERSSVPVILDAGIGTASDAALAMELGCDGVMVATAITRCRQPVRMAAAMRACRRGRPRGPPGGPDPPAVIWPRRRAR